MQALILNMFKKSNETSSRDRSRDLFIISHCVAFKHEVHLLIIDTISIIRVLYLIKVLVETIVYSEHGKVIKYTFKRGSVERSIALDEEGIPQQQAIF
jgi:hypothetical protein